MLTCVRTTVHTKHHQQQLALANMQQLRFPHRKTANFGQLPISFASGQQLLCLVVKPLQKMLHPMHRSRTHATDLQPSISNQVSALAQVCCITDITDLQDGQYEAEGRTCPKEYL